MSNHVSPPESMWGLVWLSEERAFSTLIHTIGAHDEHFHITKRTTLQPRYSTSFWMQSAASTTQTKGYERVIGKGETQLDNGGWVCPLLGRTSADCGAAANALNASLTGGLFPQGLGFWVVWIDFIRIYPAKETIDSQPPNLSRIIHEHLCLNT